MQIVDYFDTLYSLAGLHLSLRKMDTPARCYPTLDFDYIQTKVKSLPRKRRVSHGAITFAFKKRS